MLGSSDRTSQSAISGSVQEALSTMPATGADAFGCKVFFFSALFSTGPGIESGILELLSRFLWPPCFYHFFGVHMKQFVAFELGLRPLRVSFNKLEKNNNVSGV